MIITENDKKAIQAAMELSTSITEKRNHYDVLTETRTCLENDTRRVLKNLEHTLRFYTQLKGENCFIHNTLKTWNYWDDDRFRMVQMEQKEINRLIAEFIIAASK